MNNTPELFRPGRLVSARTQRQLDTDLQAAAVVASQIDLARRITTAKADALTRLTVDSMVGSSYLIDVASSLAGKHPAIARTVAELAEDGVRELRSLLRDFGQDLH